MSGDLTVGGSVLNRAGCLAGLVMASLLLSGATRAETLKDAEQWFSKIHNSGKARSPKSNHGAVKPIVEKSIIGDIPRRDKDPSEHRWRVDLCDV